MKDPGDFHLQQHGRAEYPSTVASQKCWIKCDKHHLNAEPRTHRTHQGKRYPVDQMQRCYGNRDAKPTRVLDVFLGLMLRLEEEVRLWAQGGRDHGKKEEYSGDSPSVKG